MNSILVILVVLVAFVGAEPCQLPTKLSGNFNVFAYKVSEGRVDSAIEGIVYIDQVHKRTHIEGKFGEPTSYKIIQLFEERIQFVIHDGKCMRQPVTGNFQDLTIPANASTVIKGRIGTASDGLNIIRYAGITPKAAYLTTVTEQDCIMTSGVGISRTEGENNIVYYTSFTDASTDFDDAVFDIPPECREVHGVRARRSVEGILGNVKHIFQWSSERK